MLHQLILASSDPLAAGIILRGIKGIFVSVGSVIAAFICAIIAMTKGRAFPAATQGFALG